VHWRRFFYFNNKPGICFWYFLLAYRKNRRKTSALHGPAQYECNVQFNWNDHYPRHAYQTDIDLIKLGLNIVVITPEVGIGAAIIATGGRRTHGARVQDLRTDFTQIVTDYIAQPTVSKNWRTLEGDVLTDSITTKQADSCRSGSCIYSVCPIWISAATSKVKDS